MFYVNFVSASRVHIAWLREELRLKVGIIGHLTNDGKDSTVQLKYAKKEALVIIDKMYYNPRVVCLTRKRLKVEKALKIERKQQKLYR